MHKGLVHTDKKVVEPVHYYCKNCKTGFIILINTYLHYSEKNENQSHTNIR